MYTDAQHHAPTVLTGSAPGFLAGSIALSWVSFGAADTYLQQGGQPVMADESPDHAPVDLAKRGIELPRDLGRGDRATAAFVISAQSIRVRAGFTAAWENGRAFVRAFAGGQERVRETAVTFTDGSAEADLPVVGISTAVVGVVQENWTWECRVEGGDFHAIEFAWAGVVIETVPVRIYLTAGRTLSQCSRESFLHVATTLPGAKDARHAERDVWRHFTAFRRGKFLTNARGQRLGFWRECKPGVGQAEFISRNAQDLVQSTDSSCRGWAELFREALAAHGISASVRAVRPRLSAVHPRLGLPTFLIPDGAGGKALTRTIGILVKPFKWKPQNALSPIHFARDDAELNAGRFLWKVDNPVDPLAYNWPDPDAIDLLRPGHTSPQEGHRVHGMFGNHAVVLVKRSDGAEAWYDPSFGFGPHASLLDYENDLLGRGEENHGGLFAIVGWKREERKNPVTGVIEEHNAGLLLGAAPPPPGPMLEAVDPD